MACPHRLVKLIVEKKLLKKDPNELIFFVFSTRKRLCSHFVGFVARSDLKCPGLFYLFTPLKITWQFTGQIIVPSLFKKSY